MKALFIVQPFEVPYAVHKAQVPADHGKIDGVEIPPAIETSCQVGLFFDGGVKTEAQRALETQIAVRDPMFNFQLFDQLVYGNGIPQLVKLTGRKSHNASVLSRSV